MLELLSTPEIWLSLATLSALEVVLGVDNIIFIAILSGRLPVHQRERARKLGLDPAEIRRRNFVRPADMPYRPGLTYKDGVAVTYDPGDFPAAFERAGA